MFGKKTKTIKINQEDLPNKTKTIEQPGVETIQYVKNGPSFINSIRDISADIKADVDETKGEVSKLVSSVKEIQREEKIAKRKRWIHAMKSRRRYF